MSVISGYVLEPVRVGQSNGPFTQTPDNYISSQATFDAAYPASETAPRTDYLVLVTSEGATNPGLLESARFGFTRNEVIDRFAYDSQLGAFKPLRGSAPIEVGVLSADVNTKRLRVRPPAQQAAVAAAPIRLAVGSTGSGTTWTVAVVATDADFTNPDTLTTRTVQLSKDTGNLNWRTSDVTTTYLGERVRFQQQQFFLPKDSTGRVGYAPTLVSEPVLVLSPLPGPGQYPRIRFGYGFYLTSVEVTSFSATPTSGTVEWLRSTGELKFNPTDASANTGTPVYYDGVLFATGLALPSQSLGTISSSPVTLTGLPASSGYDLIFKVEGLDAPAYHRFPSITFRAFASFDSKGKKGEVQVDPTLGRAQFSEADRTKYAGKTVTLYIADVPIERGISIRFQRNPVNLDGGLGIKDVTRVYSVTGAKWADPLIGSPQVTLPSLPIDASGYPRAIKVIQGQGTYVTDSLRDLNASPQPGLGYYIDFDSGTLYFAQRKEQQIVPLGVTSDVALPDPLLLTSNLTIELGSGNNYRQLRIGDDVLVDTTSGRVSLAATNSSLVTGTASISGSTLTDPQGQFIAKGIKAGQLVVLSASKTLYTVVSDPTSPTALQLSPQPTAGTKLTYTVYEDREVLADRYFDEVVLLDPSTKVERIWEGAARTLTPKVDYLLQPELGLVQFTDRLLTGEEARITYTVKPPSTIPATEPDAPVTEYARFLVRKEVTLDHPLPTSTLRFNPDGLPVAMDPPPAVFRGGRPQKLGIQCTVDPVLSEITFLDDGQLTDALPHGATVAPNERVYIDYYVTKAVGGEKTFTVLKPPLLTAAVTIDELDEYGKPNNKFKAPGNQTARFPAGHLLRIENELVFLLAGSTYDAAADETTVTLYDNGALTDGFSQVFPDTFNDPKLYVSSGPTPITAAPQTPAYFAPELTAYEPIARGSNTFSIAGDQSTLYRIGTVVMFTDDDKTFTDFIQVTGVAYEPPTGRTKVVLASNVLRQYVHGKQHLSRSLRPVFAPSLTEVQTSRIPKLGQPYLVYRQVAGQPGRVLTASEYTIDETGHIVFTTPLAPLEEFAICYTGLTPAPTGLNLRVSYTNQITPSATNGLLGQILMADYFIRAPDSFYFRVEAMKNFRGEFSAEISASASSGSSGPQTSNASQPKLWEQGRKSQYFDERHLANQDKIARIALQYYNDLINSMELYRRSLDGTVVGNNDGLLRFDGDTGRKKLSDPLANHIDDAVTVSNIPPFPVAKKYYQPGPLSRFYPTVKNFFGTTLAIDNKTAAGTDVLDTKSSNVTQVSNLHSRQAWGVVLEASSNSTVLRLDLASGNEPEFAAQATKYGRRAFVSGMKCEILARNGSSLVSSVTISSALVNYQVTLQSPVTVPAGSTIYQLQIDPINPTNPVPNMTTHAAGRDYSFNGETGQVTYVPQAPNSGNTPLTGTTSYAGSLTLTNTATEPLKFPALFGGVEDDDGDLSFPVQTPDPTIDLATYYAEELRLIRTGTGLIRTLTTEPKVSTTGSVNSPNFYTIVDSSISGMSPAPLPGDLIKITSGANSGTGYRRVTEVGSNYLITDATATAFVASTNFTYQLVVGLNIAPGTATSGSATTLVNTTATFLSTVKVGYTIVLTIGSVRYRRQVRSVDSNTAVTFYPSLPTTPSPVVVASGTTYRFSNPLASYGNRSGTGTLDSILEWDTALSNEQTSYGSKQTGLQPIIDQVSLGVTYFGLSQETVTTLTALKQSIPTLTPPLAALRAKFGQASVVGFDAANIFVMDLQKSDLDARETQLNTRVDPIAQAIVPTIVDVLANSEKLYDKRYVWIDARINLENGLLVRQETAVKNRIKAQAEAIKQLTKLLAVGGA